MLAIASVKGSWDAFSNGRTSWTTEQQPIPYQPTFVMCFYESVVEYQVGYFLDLGKDFTLSMKTSPERYGKIKV